MKRALGCAAAWLLLLGCSAGADTGDASPGEDNGRGVVPRTTDPCPADMVHVGDFCIDRYEASVWDGPACNGSGTQFGVQPDADDYPATWPLDGQYGDAGDALWACSLPGVLPSGWVSWFRAASACAESHKRLCTNQEWQVAATGTDKSKCPTETKQPVETDAFPDCMSRWGVAGMVGNMQEWVAEWVVSGPTWYTAVEQEAAGASGVRGTWPTFMGIEDRTYGINGSAIAGTHPDFALQPGIPNGIFRSGSYSNGVHAGPLFVNTGAAPVVAYRSGGFRCCAAVRSIASQ